MATRGRPRKVEEEEIVETIEVEAPEEAETVPVSGIDDSLPMNKQRHNY